MGMFEKKRKKKGQMLPIFKCNNWLHRMKIYRATLTNSGIEQCCLVVWPFFFFWFRVDVDFMDYLKFCWLNRIFFSFILKKRKEKSSLCCTHTKKWISSQEGQGSRVPTPRHFNVHFYDDFKKKMNKNVKEIILSTESYGFQKKRKYLLFLNP